MSAYLKLKSIYKDVIYAILRAMNNRAAKNSQPNYSIIHFFINVVDCRKDIICGLNFCALKFF